MADAPWLFALSRGCCSRAAAAEKGCALCVPRYEAIDRLAAVVEAAQAQVGGPSGDQSAADLFFALVEALEDLENFGSDDA